IEFLYSVFYRLPELRKAVFSAYAPFIQGRSGLFFRFYPGAVRGGVVAGDIPFFDPKLAGVPERRGAELPFSEPEDLFSQVILQIPVTQRDGGAISHECDYQPQGEQAAAGLCGTAGYRSSF